jgi:Domain of unknown function (DUF4373)
MARPIKEGLEYFPLDVDFFNDEKIEAISGEFGLKGEIIVIKLLCTIYRNGYYTMWNELTKMKLLKSIPGVSIELLEQVITRLVKWNFFDENLFSSAKVLTSNGIQKRFLEATKRRKKEVNIVYVCNNGVNVYNNPPSSVVNVHINTQSKVKESKVKESKVFGEKSPTHPPSKIELRKEEFYNSLKEFVKTYGKEMVRKFFDYWSELNIPQTKMKFEMEKTWELSKRLATWSSRENTFKKSTPEESINQNGDFAKLKKMFNE